ncbi:hypothetical protein JTB14_007792 [Gonioctena quinquepunctata]|nr:hypothetical protein JTB14_007792 [Gonioctena quinquepunctata]
MKKRSFIKLVVVYQKAKYFIRQDIAIHFKYFMNHKTILGLDNVYDDNENKIPYTNEDSRTTTNIRSEHSYTQPKSSEEAFSAEVKSPIASTSKLLLVAEWVFPLDSFCVLYV